MGCQTPSPGSKCPAGDVIRAGTGRWAARISPGRRASLTPPSQGSMPWPACHRPAGDGGSTTRSRPGSRRNFPRARGTTQRPGPLRNSPGSGSSARFPATPRPASARRRPRTGPTTAGAGRQSSAARNVLPGGERDAATGEPRTYLYRPRGSGKPTWAGLADRALLRVERPTAPIRATLLYLVLAAKYRLGSPGGASPWSGPSLDAPRRDTDAAGDSPARVDFPHLIDAARGS